MTGEELAKYCENMDCDKCEHTKACEAFRKALSDHAPFFLLYQEKIKRMREELLKKNFNE